LLIHPGDRCDCRFLTRLNELGRMDCNDKFQPLKRPCYYVSLKRPTDLSIDSMEYGSTEDKGAGHLMDRHRSSNSSVRRDSILGLLEYVQTTECVALRKVETDKCYPQVWPHALGPCISGYSITCIRPAPEARSCCWEEVVSCELRVVRKNWRWKPGCALISYCWNGGTELGAPSLLGLKDLPIANGMRP
jgi:hypothetical protein